MVRRRKSWILAFLVALVAVSAAIAALAAAPPNVAKAIAAQRHLAAERPQDPAVWNDLGNLLLLARHAKEAEEAYRKAVELDPNKTSALFNLGLLLQQRGELREALRLYEQVVKLDPQHAWAQYQIGSVYEARHQDSKAIEAYGRAFALDPQLAFPEVNPHVVDNKLVTQAMLRAYRSDYAVPQAPRVYDDPNRIAGLLVPVVGPAPADAKETAADKKQPGVRANPAAAAPGQAAGKPTVLRPGDLQPGNTAGQATPQGMAVPGRVPGSSASRGVPGVGVPGGAPRGLRQWNRPEPNEEPYDPEGAAPNRVIAPPPQNPGGVYYRPGVPSSGRLDLSIVPERQGRRTARG
jgi:tetratricopeptide repeat protein